ncbi:hypothetical protein H0H81_011449 [Sphagnurus paluster]|uniref:Uncharacterized protein n=1 Tax=Sphagnurus paluster TaxID=117069 RepID=A0A9P7FQE5_9AGAR|nr:hypothetical protein H0H81_011449 [Sphagnurus paluster]
MLPLALLDLTLLRLSAPTPVQAASCALKGSPWASARRMHQASLATPPPPPHLAYNYKNGPAIAEKESPISLGLAGLGSLGPRPGQIISDARSELERRVKALEEAASTEMSALDPPSYTEEELMFIYEDLLALPPVSEVENKLSPTELAQQQAEEDTSVIKAAEQRLLAPDPGEEISSPTHHRLLAHINAVVTRVEAVRKASMTSADAESPAFQNSLPVTVLSTAEFESLLRVCIRDSNISAAEMTLTLMKRSGFVIPQNIVTNTMELYARAGNVTAIEKTLATYLTDFPNEYQRYLHIKSHLVSTPADVIPASTLDVLHSYETQGHPAPIQAYTSVITSLFSCKSSLARAQAWDLFSHMRYVAHPDPDVPLYTLMIRACASPLGTRPSEPEKALDLWTEMTVDRRLPPTAGAYDAIILACARSGSTMYVNEAFRLAKQMLDAHRDARGESAFRPSRRTFCALLEGAKRVGDLARARWILAQMIAEQRTTDDTGNPEGVNEEVMMHVFHAYASYRPPLNRSAVRSATHPSSSLGQVAGQSVDAPTPTVSHEPTHPSGIEAYDRTPTFTQVPPQSGAEVIHETQILFDRILHDTGLKKFSDIPDSGATFLDEKFKDVEMTPRLLNSYLSVYYRHSSLETARTLYQTLFEEYGIPRTARTCVEALERCAIARRGHERTIAPTFADEVWTQWQSLEETGRDGERLLSGRIIERAHIAMIRILSLTNNVARAVQHLRAFAAKYPPSDLRNAPPKPALRSTRTALVGERPLVRMTSAAEVPDDHVPPLIMFDDVEILHHRLVAQNSVKEISYLSYICKAYECALRARRDAALKMKPETMRTHPPEARISSPSE